MEREGIVRTIDTLIRGLTHSDMETHSQDIKILRAEVEQEDMLKLASLLEDLLVLLKDDPENKARIKITWNRLMEGYGHIKPLSELLKSVRVSYQFGSG